MCVCVCVCFDSFAWPGEDCVSRSMEANERSLDIEIVIPQPGSRRRVGRNLVENKERQERENIKWYC